MSPHHIFQLLATSTLPPVSLLPRLTKAFAMSLVLREVVGVLAAAIEDMRPHPGNPKLLSENLIILRCCPRGRPISSVQ